MLVDPDHGHAVEPGGIVDQDPLALLQHRVVGGVPRHPRTFGDPRDGQVRDHDPFQRPPQPPPRQPRARFGSSAGVLAPHMPALGASVAADRDQQDRRAPPERLVCQPPDHAVARGALAATAPAPPLIAVGGLNDPARQDRPVGLEALTGHLQPELIQTAERRQIGTAEARIDNNTGRVRHVEVFRVGGVGTLIRGRPRCSGHELPVEVQVERLPADESS